MVKEEVKADLKAIPIVCNIYGNYVTPYRIFWLFYLLFILNTTPSSFSLFVEGFSAIPGGRRIMNFLF